MSTASGKPTFSSTCVHTHTVEDHHEGVTVCTDCGLVINNQLFVPSYEHMTHVETESESSKTKKIQSFLADVCEHMHVPSLVLNNAVDKFKLLREYFSTVNKKFKDDEIAAYTLYESLNEHKVPRSAQDVQYYTGISCNALWNIEKHLPSSAAVVKAEDLMDPICKELEIAFYHVSMMKNIAQNITGLGSVLPQSTCAVIIYLFSKKFRLG